MEERWMVAAKRGDFAGIGRAVGLDPVVVRLMRNRDVFVEQDSVEAAAAKVRRYLGGSLADLYDPSLMKDLPEGAAIIQNAIREGKRIRVIGDYDIDGVTSSYILVTGFRRLGGAVDVQIPERIRDGYGLNERLVRDAAADGVQLLVTCDNGIAAAEQIRLGKALGLSIVVTDHHQVPFTEGADGEKHYMLPPADAVIDAHRADDTYPFKGLCGAGVAWKLIQYLYRAAALPDAAAEELLECVAIATIGDVMDLAGENRILVKEGLARLHHTQNLGLQELIAQNGVALEEVDVYHVGFVIGPCLNASGRLDTAQRALQLLFAADRGEAARLAGDLISLNQSRKAMTEEGAAAAIDLVEQSDMRSDPVLVVYLPEVHESIAGIIAGRVREHFYRPTLIITKSEDGAKGSGRSIEGYHMFEALQRAGDLLTKFGGHAMAAGLSLPEANIEPLRRRLNAACTLTAAQLQPKITVDIALPIAYVTENLLAQMQRLAPFGKGNTRPLFAEKNLTPRWPRVLGKNRNVCKLQLVDAGGCAADAVFFGDADAFAAYAARKGALSVVYYPEINEWRGRRSLQLVIQSYR